MSAASDFPAGHATGVCGSKTPLAHAMAEYRWLDVDDGGTRQGWLVGVDRDLGRNFRVGAGYNFTDFSDDLTDFDYDHKGWFVNFVGSY